MDATDGFNLAHPQKGNCGHGKVLRAIGSLELVEVGESTPLFLFHFSRTVKAKAWVAEIVDREWFPSRKMFKLRGLAVEVQSKFS